jgi:hypothetical protein
MLTRLMSIFALAALVLCLGSDLKIDASPIDRNDVVRSEGGDRRDDASPWGVASGSEWLSAFPLFNPMLKNAGVGWLRGFYEWQTIQPKQDSWNWVLPDRLVANARDNRIHLTFGLAYLASWASADGGTRKFPIKDMQFWRDYVSAMVGRYHDDIKYWEVWNEFNGSFAENGTPQIYADLVREASIAAKKIDPAAKVGLSVANFDVGFLDAAIKSGAANHFDYICVHPYEKINALADDGEVDFLTMTTTLRKMLASNGQPANMPLWITEIGSQAPVIPNQEGDRSQAIALAKAYLLSIASGFTRVFWFEARGPSYGAQTDHGLIRSDLTPRPSYQALQVMTEVLGAAPRGDGWLNLGNGGYGFLFLAQGKNVLAAWAPAGRTIKVTFDADVGLAALDGTATRLLAGKELILSSAPILIDHVPGALVAQAHLNPGKPYPWGGQHGQARVVTATLQAKNIENGIKQVNPNTTSAVILGDSSWRKTDFSIPDAEGHYVYFSVDPQFVPFGTRELEISAMVRRIGSDKMAGMALNYESQTGYVDAGYFNIPEGDQWHELSWKVSDANFVGGWGWNFRLNAIASPNEFMIKGVSVRKIDPR